MLQPIRHRVLAATARLVWRLTARAPILPTAALLTIHLLTDGTASAATPTPTPTPVSQNCCYCICGPQGVQIGTCQPSVNDASTCSAICGVSCRASFFAQASCNSGCDLFTPTPAPTSTFSATSTPSPTQLPATATPPATSTPSATPTAIVTATDTLSPTRTATTLPPPTASKQCTGDCGQQDRVDVSNLVVMVNIALGTAEPSTCIAGDANHDGRISVDELVTAVNNALNGCPS